MMRKVTTIGDSHQNFGMEENKGLGHALSPKLGRIAKRLPTSLAILGVCLFVSGWGDDSVLINIFTTYLIEK